MTQTNRDLTENSTGCEALRDTGGAGSDKDTAIIAAARRVCEDVLGPNAADTDQSAGPNRANFRALAEAGLLGMGMPTEWGGLNASGAAQRAVTEIMASYCGVTTFTQAQHHGPCRMILSGPNEDLKRLLLPDLTAGRMLCAVSFAHLRRPGPPVLRAEPVEGGWKLFGTAPWVTGYGLMNQVMFGASLPDERHIYLWAPFDREAFPALFENVSGPSRAEWGSLAASPPLPLCAMNASATVELTCDGWFIPAEHKLSESDRETMRVNDRNNVLGACPMPLGCGAASVRLLCETAEHRQISAIARASQAFLAEWQAMKAAIESWNGRSAEPEFFENAVRLRAQCITFGMRAAHAAVTASSGAANGIRHPAQRLLREAMFYTIQAQTIEVMDSTLALLES